MKGTIDQVEAFFAGISTAWARALTFLIGVCAGHLLGMFASDFIWMSGSFYSGFELMLIPSAPLSWLWAFAVSFLVPWQGLLLLAVIGTGFYFLVYTDAPRLPIICCLVI